MGIKTGRKSVPLIVWLNAEKEDKPVLKTGRVASLVCGRIACSKSQTLAEILDVSRTPVFVETVM